jgi:aldehyde dehydrogenase (NAD+)
VSDIPELGRTGHWIDGREAAPAAGRYRPVTSPADRRTVAEIADGDAADVHAVVTAASAARRTWARTSAAERSAVLHAVAAAMRANVDGLAAREAAECGKLGAPREVLAGAEYFDYYAAVVRTLHGETIDQGPGTHTYTRHEPYGVVAIVTPWNAPLNQACRGVAPALAAGNTVVVKPSEYTSSSTLLLGRVASEAGLPPGVLNVVTGTGEAVGAPLVSHPDVRKVAFTGSPATGRAIGRIAGDRIIPTTLELGGKSPMIVFADADLDAAATAAARAALANSGQVCSATTRLLVERPAQAEFVQKVGAILAAKQPTTDFGPIITEPQFHKVLGFLDSAKDEGATLVTGGAPYTAGPGAAGFYVAPTLYSDVTPEMRIAREEIFGPVLAAIAFDTAGEAVELANASEYGLAASVWAGDGARGLAVAERLEAGQVAVNGGVMGNETPFGGYKNSGHGREKGVTAIYEYAQLKTISLGMPT